MSDETVCGFGGSGGTVRPPFVLRDDETIAAIEGGSGDALDRIQFVTSSGRQSPPFGGAGGAPFRLELPEGRAIGGLQITQSGALLFPSSHVSSERPSAAHTLTRARWRVGGLSARLDPPPARGKRRAYRSTFTSTPGRACAT